MSYGILLLRLVLGLTFVGHGAQKLFGAFGGLGLQGTGGYFAGLGYRAPVAMALIAGLCEMGGGLLLACGLLTPLAGLAIAVLILNAIGAQLWQRGFWIRNNGYEYGLLIWTVAVALAAAGGGRFSLDAALGWAGSVGGLWWGLSVIGASALIAALTLRFGREVA